jgi:hypothetical protein
MSETTHEETFCGICGHLLTRLMIAAEFDGKYMDYEAAKRRAREMSEWDGAGTATRP